MQVLCPACVQARIVYGLCGLLVTYALQDNLV
jgi:glutaredoxin 2